MTSFSTRNTAAGTQVTLCIYKAFASELDIMEAHRRLVKTEATLACQIPPSDFRWYRGALETSSNAKLGWRLLTKQSCYI